MNDNFKGESPAKDFGFVLSLAALMLFSLMGVGIDFDEYTQHQEINIPLGYFYFIFLVDLVMIVSLIFIFFYKQVNAVIFRKAIYAFIIIDTLFVI